MAPQATTYGWHGIEQSYVLISSYSSSIIDDVLIFMTVRHQQRAQYLMSVALLCVFHSTTFMPLLQPARRPSRL